VILLPRDFAFGGRVDLLVRRDGARWPRAAGDWLRARARAERAAARGVSEEDLAAWDQAPEVRRVASIAAEAGRSGSVRAERIVVIAILLLGMTVVLSTISYLMIAISGEKQARVTEVVVSAIPAQAWMDGKIVAYTLIGLVMMAVWAGSLLAAAVPLAFAMPGSVNAALVAVTLALTVLGLYFYNAFFAALMASLQGMQSTSKFQGYFFLLPFVPLFFLVPVLESPDAAWVGVISQVPFFSSSLIPARMTSHAVQPWEVALAFAVLVASCWLMRLVAGRIFRLGMLLYGKDATLPELVRWAREA
jgi:ABC-2 type transport system permease protein